MKKPYNKPELNTVLLQGINILSQSFELSNIAGVGDVVDWDNCLIQ